MEYILYYFYFPFVRDELVRVILFVLTRFSKSQSEGKREKNETSDDEMESQK
jgi:hypothetical protein